jgi:hypothetical protein
MSHVEKGLWCVHKIEQVSHETCIKEVKHLNEYVENKARELPAAQSAVQKSLKDPDSAKFGDFYLYDEKQACLTVNARNSYGGYTGDQLAVLNKINGVLEVLDISRDAHYVCAAICQKTDAADRLRKGGVK